jgi:hypothetical protein
VDVYNNTGDTANVCAWVDFNNNGVFELGEGTCARVPTGTDMRRIDLFWSGIVTSLPAFSTVPMRIRLTTSTMTASNSTGYFANGEVEDYTVLVNQATLPFRITHFSAAKLPDNKVQIDWKVTEEEPGMEYIVERSNDSRNWDEIHSTKVALLSSLSSYQYTDGNPASPVSYYRIKYRKTNGDVRHTVISKIDFTSVQSLVLSPNPAIDHLKLEMVASTSSKGSIMLYSMDGKIEVSKGIHFNKGYNKLSLVLPESIKKGVYTVKIIINEEVFFRKIVISK